MKPLVLVIFGTRPEAIKMAPVVKALQNKSQVQVKTCVSAQHREMLDQVLMIFNIRPDYDLDIMTENQDLFSLTSRLLGQLQVVLEEVRPSLILVHGDTTTTMAASMAAFYSGIPVGHVEAGLRTGNMHHPFPEEMNRKVTAVLADFHFAPTEKSGRNLLGEGVKKESIFITGNTVIDSLFAARKQVEEDVHFQEKFDSQFAMLASFQKMVLITGHRRENFGVGFEGICRALVRLAKGFPTVSFVYPVHLNPNVQQPVNDIVQGTDVSNVFLIKPVDYLTFVELMNRCYLVLTDSGGVQEEAPSLGKPVVVMRNTTERLEAVAAGTVELVGSDEEKIYSHVVRLFNDQQHYRTMSVAENPYGDGHAAERIADHVVALMVTKRS